MVGRHYKWVVIPQFVKYDAVDNPCRKLRSIESWNTPALVSKDRNTKQQNDDTKFKNERVRVSHRRTSLIYFDTTHIEKGSLSALQLTVCETRNRRIRNFKST